MPDPTAADSTPLAVDLDGTLLATDTLWELIAAFLRGSPRRFAILPLWILQGKASFKARLASETTLDIESLPCREDLVVWLRKEKLAGRHIVLATGSDQKIAEAVAARFGFFDAVAASDGKRNLTGASKANLLESMFGGPNYHYIGNSMTDLAIWRNCGSAIVAAPDRGVIAALQQAGIPVLQRFDAPAWTFRTWRKALRIHQWIKNLLIFLPLLTSHQLFAPAPLFHVCLGFVAYSLAASATYIINDFLDLSADRRHVSKRYRPLASGVVSIPLGLVVCLLLLATAAAISFFMPARAALLLLAYCIATLTYSAAVKKMLIADVVALALFYTLRVVYGGLASGIEISIWTLAFCTFAFFALSTAKRINDLSKTELHPRDSLHSRAYRMDDRMTLVSQAAAAGNIAVLVLILYLNSPQVEALYLHPRILWGMCPLLLYWFNRIIALANRGSLPDDPVVFASKDKISWCILVLLIVCAAAATF